jgi:hypothetical protein
MTTRQHARLVCERTACQGMIRITQTPLSPNALYPEISCIEFTIREHFLGKGIPGEW